MYRPRLSDFLKQHLLVTATNIEAKNTDRTHTMATDNIKIKEHGAKNRDIYDLPINIREGLELDESYVGSRNA